ncbi:MAG: HD domain-containing protein [Ruminococcus sp.]|nr:HD domain-containing protein [Ruminococcus sp.]
MKIDKKCLYILEKLENAGFQAYLVGGCVRDMIMNRPVNDFDITTNAFPEQTASVFSSDKVIPTGIKHGTVTVIHENESFEITTFRIDGNYSDSRRPDNVEFTSNLTDDLARRDFTVNAIAMDSHGNLSDPFGGAGDIENKIIRCVGVPDKRFSEDALRILRCFRFASVLGFDIDPITADSALKMRKSLSMVSAERISAELVKLLGGVNVIDVMLKYRDIIGQIIPEMTACFDFEQHSRYHKYTVYEHIVRAVASVSGNTPESRIIRIAMLFHDIGKPSAFRLDEKGFGHFYGHAGISADMAVNILKRMKFDNRTIDEVCWIIAHHSDKITGEKSIKHLLSQRNLESFLMLIEAKKADNSAKQDFVTYENAEFCNFAETAKRLVSENSCLHVGDMTVNGNDMISLGFRGAEIGKILNQMLGKIIDGELENSREILMNYAGGIKNE